MSGNLEFGSLSSAMMCAVTVYRNQPNVEKSLTVSGGYLVTTVVAVVESVATALFSIWAYIITPFYPDLCDRAVAHLSSSLFCIFWSIEACFFNLITDRAMIADEQSARRYWKSLGTHCPHAFYHIVDSRRAD